MTITTRRLLLLSFFILFLLAGSAVLFYSFGWKLNLENFHLQKTGAIAIETSPKGVILKINGKPVPDDSGFIQKHTLISGLLPKVYDVSVEKEKYLPYRKKLKVEPSLVTEVLNIVLVPENIIPQTILSQIRGEEIVDFANNKAIVKNGKAGIHYLYSLENASSTFNINASFANLRKNPPIKIRFHPFEPGQILVETRGGLNIFDTDKLKAETIVERQVQAWDVKGSSAYFVQSEEFFDSQSKTTSTVPFLYSFNLIFKNKVTLLEMEDAEINQPIAGLAVSGSADKFAFIDSSGKFFLYDRAKNTFAKIADDIKLFEFSPNDGAIAYLDFEGGISILFLEDWHISTRKKPGEKISLELGDGSVIQAIEWYKDSFHLLAKRQDRLDFVEIDSRSAPNVYAVSGNLNSYFYDPGENRIYISFNNKLLTIKIEE